MNPTGYMPLLQLPTGLSSESINRKTAGTPGPRYLTEASRVITCWVAIATARWTTVYRGMRSPSQQIPRMQIHCFLAGSTPGNPLTAGLPGVFPIHGQTIRLLTGAVHRWSMPTNIAWLFNPEPTHFSNATTADYTKQMTAEIHGYGSATDWLPDKSTGLAFHSRITGM